MKKSSKFESDIIREPNAQEEIFLKNFIRFMLEDLQNVIVGYIDKRISNDNKSRPLILTSKVLEKITSKHGEFTPINLIITVHEWDIAIKNIDHNENKICLLKHVPNSNNILLIGAYRKNGFYILTHYEVGLAQDNQLKSLLGRGDVLERMSDRDPLCLPIKT